MMCKITEDTYKIVSVKNQAFSSNTYFIYHSLGECIVIDPVQGDDFFKVLNKNHQIRYVILTHEHYDHLSGIEDIYRISNPRLIESEKWDFNLTEFESQIRLSEVYRRLRKSGYQKINRIYCPTADIRFCGTMELKWNGLLFEFMEAPGHTDGSIIIIFDRKYLFCGDSLSEEKTVITTLIGGNRIQYRDITLPLMENLNPQYIVLPGHGSPFLLGKALKNPYLNKYRNYRA